MINNSQNLLRSVFFYFIYMSKCTFKKVFAHCPLILKTVIIKILSIKTTESAFKTSSGFDSSLCSFKVGKMLFYTVYHSKTQHCDYYGCYTSNRNILEHLVVGFNYTMHP